jgi:hypothetical protein
LAVLWSHGRVVRDVLLQEPGGQLSGKGAGAAFPLRERDRGWIRPAVEIEIEGGSRLFEPLLAELFAAGVHAA